MLATDRTDKSIGYRAARLTGHGSNMISIGRNRFLSNNSTWCQDAEAIVRADRVIRLSLGMIVARTAVLPAPSAEKRLTDALIFYFHHQVTIGSVFWATQKKMSRFV